jgi:hypothetical protein
MPMDLKRSMFEDNLNTRFWLLDESSQPQPLDLVEMTEGHLNPRLEQFSLHFRGDGNRIFPQRTYPIKHDAIGEFDLFLVPIAQDATGTLYEAVFNRLIQEQAPDR